MGKKYLDKPPIGKSKMRVLECLASYPAVTRNQIAEKSEGDLTNTIRDVEALIEEKYVEQSGNIMVKGSDRPTYQLSKMGIGFLWAYSPSVSSVKASCDNYEKYVGAANNEIYKTLPDGLLVKLLRFAGRAILKDGEKAFDIHYLLISVFTNMNSNLIAFQFDRKDLKALRRYTQDPDVRKNIIKEKDRFNNSIDKMLSSLPEDSKDE